MEQFKNISMKLLRPHWAIMTLEILASGAGLGWVFLGGWEKSLLAIPIYVLSFYALTVVCVRVTPGIVRGCRNLKARQAARTPQQRMAHFMRMLYLSLGINVIYAVFNLVTGIVLGSTWMGSNGLYYLINSLIHLVMLRCQRRLDRMDDEVQKHHLGWSCFQMCGVLLFVLHLTMTGVIFLMIRRNTGTTYPGFMIFAVAAYTFYKLTIAIIRVVQRSKHLSPVLGAARNIDLSEAMMSMFALQMSMFSAFGEDFQQQRLMNSISGGVVCFLTVLGSIGMALHGSKRRKEINHG